MEVKNGSVLPFGVTSVDSGLNFSVYVKNADLVFLCLFHENDTEIPYEKIEMSRTADIWHIFIKELSQTLVYAFEVKKNDKIYLVLDPYAKGIVSEAKWHIESRKDFIYRPLGKITSSQFNWENDFHPNIPKKNLIIYEMHVRGFTCHSTSKVKNPGTFDGLIEKIPYLMELGINAVELMPIQEFCEEDVLQVNPENQKKLHNYFGYSTVNFFSLMNRYASQSSKTKLL